MKDDREDPSVRKSASEKIPETKNRVRVDELDEKKRAKVVDIEGGLGLKKRFSQMGIHPGDIVTVLRYGPLGGAVVIEVHGFQLALGRGVASKIYVEEVRE